MSEQFPKGTGVSYGELAILGDMFDRQYEAAGLDLGDDKLGCFIEFCEDYENGNMDPRIRLPNGEYFNGDY